MIVRGSILAERGQDLEDGEVLLCERGIRSYDRITRNVLDLAAIPVEKAPAPQMPQHAGPKKGLLDGELRFEASIAAAKEKAKAQGKELFYLETIDEQTAKETLNILLKYQTDIAKATKELTVDE